MQPPNSQVFYNQYDYPEKCGPSTTLADPSNNGDIVGQTISAKANAASAYSWTQTYTYDQVNRIQSASEQYNAATTWSRTYGYDHFGNRWISAAPYETLHMATP